VPYLLASRSFARGLIFLRPISVSGAQSQAARSATRVVQLPGTQSGGSGSGTGGGGNSGGSGGGGSGETSGGDGGWPQQNPIGGTPTPF
jgi:hypothetical protein